MFFDDDPIKPEHCSELCTPLANSLIAFSSALTHLIVHSPENMKNTITDLFNQLMANIVVMLRAAKIHNRTEKRRTVKKEKQAPLVAKVWKCCDDLKNLKVTHVSMTAFALQGVIGRLVDAVSEFTEIIKRNEKHMKKADDEDDVEFEDDEDDEDFDDLIDDFISDDNKERDTSIKSKLDDQKCRTEKQKKEEKENKIRNSRILPFIIPIIKLSGNFTNKLSQFISRFEERVESSNETPIASSSTTPSPIEPASSLSSSSSASSSSSEISSSTQTPNLSLFSESFFNCLDSIAIEAEKLTEITDNIGVDLQFDDDCISNTVLLCSSLNSLLQLTHRLTEFSSSQSKIPPWVSVVESLKTSLFEQLRKAVSDQGLSIAL
eukprot:MONOS_6068.1-p1 / transcript=MONOS_6068.1 / gene=MONOS_6068 / organism=Monocercomonoides_exilis_PA203 / gene_product=unspecified product / transcript_product=unspecified product / location=Mono_scaffold00186:34299-35488(+) / protein_length=377 / sequence_SO=supercontig / SO=protein_coding / is_pseudo=false